MKGYFRLVILAGILIGGMLGVLFFVSNPAWAHRPNSALATITVNTLDDELNSDGDCSLREAVNAANLNISVDTCPAGSPVITDTITFFVSGTIALEAELDIAETGGPLLIDGAGEIILDGGDSAELRIFNVNGGADLILESLEITSGSHNEGGGIYNSGDLIIRNGIISENVAWSTYTGGGGIYNLGTLSIISSTLVGNYTFYHIGGGIYNLGQLSLRNSILDSNGAYHNGGGIYNNGVMTITNSILTSNSAGYYGGGIENSGTVYLMNSTLVDNHALYGGGISTGGEMTITNSTLSGNSAGYDGGAIGGGGILAIESSTLSNNSASGFGGGIKVSGGMGYSLRNTIVANNTATVDGPDCYAMAITSGGYNLIGDKSGCMFTPTTGDLTGVDAKLGVLQDNGGPTLTHALSSGSLAIDHANPDGCKNAANNLLAADQRGMSRHGRCDIGAYEWQPAPFGTNTLFLPTIIRSCASAFYFDDFSNPASGWPSGESTNVLIEYLNNEYRILVKNPHVSVGASPGSVISDYIVVSDVRNVTGTYGAYGIMFDYVPDDLHLYVFGIDPASNYAIWRVVDGAWTPLASGFTDSIHSETASNQLKIERKGRQIWAYVNGELLNIIDEATLTGSRHLGLLARSYAETNVDIRFDNFTVYPITCGASSTLLSQGGGMAVNKVFDMGFPKSWQVQHSQSIIP